MSFIGRATVWSPAGAADATVQSNRGSRQSATRLTPLNVMTGSRIAASRNGVVRWVGANAWGEPGQEAVMGTFRRWPGGWFATLARNAAPRPVEAPKVCPRCGQAPHNDWGYAYERLVCQETTAA